MDLVGSLLRKSLPKRTNVLTFSCHERYQSHLKDVAADFYLLEANGTKKWDKRYAAPPKNHFICQGNFPEWLQPDILLSQNLFAHYAYMREIQTKVYLPLVSLEHCLPVNLSVDQIKAYKDSATADVHIFITDYNREAWGFAENEAVVIPHAIDTEVFRPGVYDRQNVILTVANEYPQRHHVLGFEQYLRVTQGLPVRPVGHSPGFSVAAKNLDELIGAYQTSRIFLNTADKSPCPLSLLEAMACGCAIVSCKATAIGDYIFNGYNGFLCDNDKQMRGHLEDLLKDERLAQTLGRNARAAIVEKCSLERFTNQWNGVIDGLAKRN